jgi:hypothetical protein
MNPQNQTELQTRSFNPEQISVLDKAIQHARNIVSTRHSSPHEGVTAALAMFALLEIQRGETDFIRLGEQIVSRWHAAEE